MPTTPGLFRRLRRASLSVKLAALGAVVMAVVVALAFWALSIEIRGNTRDVYAQQLARNQRTLQQLQAEEATQLLFAASLVAQTPSFQYDMSTYRVERNSSGQARTDLLNTVEGELQQRMRSVGGDLLLVTDDSGRVFASADPRGTVVPLGTNLTSLASLRAVLDPRAPADSGGLSVLRTNGAHLEVAAYPLVQGGITLGALVLGRRLDSAFVAAARAASDADVILTAGDSVMSASEPMFSVAGTVARLEHGTRDRGATTAHFGGDDYVIAAVPLGETQDRQPVQLWMLQPLSRRVAALMGPLRTDFILYGGLAVVLAALGAGLVARTVLGPFHGFVRHMRSGAAAEQRQARFDADGAALEVRTLNDSFNQLMDSLAVKRRELEERTADLVAANVVLTDEISERTRVERALRESEAQLRQSQKLEAIGTLAGGIAHDFNNLITVISGYTQLALMRAEPSSAAADDLRQVVDASDRAANLTHQLLAFSRKQVLQPTVLDLGDVVDGIVPMLRRIIGEHIDLEIEADESLARIRADRGQLEQVLVNLAVNARDAMPSGRGGTLTIATRNVGAPHGDGRRPSSAAAPRGVALIVSDTGAGMPDDVKERIFEPFFTTKEPGKGTGLGLSTVYGIVNQSGGVIEVASAIGAGTTFTITLPAAEAIGGGDGGDGR